jgi:Cys-tRNA(Pro)/Cys-tRNA(Cys) deacylase
MNPLPAHQFLDDRAIPYRAHTFSPDTPKGAANVAHALGFRERQMVKTLIFVDVKRDEKVLVMLGGDPKCHLGASEKGHRVAQY